MTKVKEMIGIGYKYLADDLGRLMTEKALEGGTPWFQVPNEPVAQTALELYLSSLDKVGGTGKVLSLTEEELNGLGWVRYGLDRAMAPELRPKTPKQSFSMVIGGLESFYGDKEVDLFMSTLEKVVPHSPSFGTQFTTYEGEKETNHIVIYFNPEYPLVSTVNNAHIIGAYFVPERREYHKIARSLGDVRGYGELMERINKDEALSETRVSLLPAEGDFEFFSKSEILELARESGVDMGGLAGALSKKDEASYLWATSLGKSYLEAGEIACRIPELSGIPRFANACRALGLTECLIAPHSKLTGRKNWAGIGMARYFREHPEEKNGLIGSETFLRDFSKALYA